jgi:hypothetical protein
MTHVGHVGHVGHVCTYLTHMWQRPCDHQNISAMGACTGQELLSGTDGQQVA